MMTQYDVDRILSNMDEMGSNGDQVCFWLLAIEWEIRLERLDRSKRLNALNPIYSFKSLETAGFLCQVIVDIPGI
jgi:hypothetical protein